MNTFKTTIEKHVRGMDTECAVTIQYTACPGSPGNFEEPAEPAHIEIESATEDETGVEIELTTAQENAIEQAIAEDLADADDFARSEQADRERDERHERGLR